MSDDAPLVHAPSPSTAGAHRVRRHRLLRMLLLFLTAWAVIAYLIVPRLWEVYFNRHPDYADVARVSVTSDGHPGDPVNLALLGSEEELIRGMTAAGWFPADPITFRTSVRIVADSVLRRPDDNAPVSNLFLFGRKQDLAFEQPVGDDPRRRHHVRFWRWDRLENSAPVWFGSATYDERVGLSYTTGQVTHHIGPDVDAERDRIVADLAQAGCTSALEWQDGFQPRPEGRNGGGDIWRTDGRLAIVELRPCKLATGSSASRGNVPDTR